MQDLVQLFVTLAPERLAAVAAALRAHDAPAAESAAHALGSGCGQLGALRMQRLAVRLERLAGEGNLAEVAPLLGELEEEFARYREWLVTQISAEERVA